MEDDAINQSPTVLSFRTVADWSVMRFLKTEIMIKNIIYRKASNGVNLLISLLPRLNLTIHGQTKQKNILRIVLD